MLNLPFHKVFKVIQVRLSSQMGFACDFMFMQSPNLSELSVLEIDCAEMKAGGNSESPWSLAQLFPWHILFYRPK